jgi:hypothetical protein
MLTILQVVSTLLVAAAMALSLAHALELPGKMRLSKEAYVAMQPIYYPGFTIGGVAEPAGILALLLLVILTPSGTTAFWLTAAALLALAASHAVYWLVTHPINNFRLEDTKLAGAGARFFAADPLKRGESAERRDWTALRDRWEYSHVARATLSFIALALLAVAIAV